jgi:CcmD family protein
MEARTCSRRQLISRNGRERLDALSSLGYLAAVNVVVWVGIFLYLWRLDRSIGERERSR